jgi:hypothetical protein
VTDEEFRAIIAAGPAVVMVESRHMIALLDERDALRAENARMRETLEGMLSGSKYNDEERWWVLIGTPTSKELSAACTALDPDGQKERRAKALAELAEMDADLLDIDPEMKLAWPPAGCIRIDSCERHGRCMYLRCVNQGKKAAPGVKP